MEANELRIGNLILKNGSIYNIDTLFFVDIYDGTAINFHLKPIHLTEEWLLRFGFEKTMEWTYSKELLGNSKLVYYLGEKGWSIGFKNYSDFSNLTYVHQLQNLYFALTGEELTIKN
jgi:hypothetical protein